MCDFAGFTTKPVKKSWKENVDMGGEKKVGSEGFQDKDFREIRELIDPMPEELTEDNLIGMSASKPGQEAEEEDIGEAVPESNLTSDNPAKGFQLFKTDFDFFYSMDPSMI